MINCDVVIIDSGFNVDKNIPISGVCIEKSANRFTIGDDLSDDIGHGTIIYSIIAQQVDAHRIYVIKLCECLEDYSALGLIEALKYVKQNVKCKIINVSLGLKTSDDLNELYDICSEISELGVIIISAFDNEGCYSYPAAFDCVIGVDGKKDIYNIAEFDYVENSPINILAKGNLQRIKMQDGRILLIGGASIACAHITSFLINIINDTMNRHSALLYLKSKARYIYCSKKSKQENNRYFKVKKAAVFPFTKEAQAFLRFSDRISFKIQGYYDIRRSGKVGRSLNSYYEKEKSLAHIMDIEQIDFSDIDTLILGYLDELNFLSNRDYRKELVAKAVNAKVNIFSFDPLDQYINLLIESNVKYYYPKLTQDDIPQNTFGKLYKISKPVVGIFGTSSKQGKFSLQIAVKEKLETRGYNVGTIGTEPHSLLFDFDVVFPMGYNSTVYLQNSQIVIYLNNEINNLCLKGKELILVAAQAQTVPYYCNNLLEYPSMQYHFAMGTKPDAIIMCVNYHDEIPYIRNTMYALKGLTDADVIAFVMYPITYSDDWNGGYRNSVHKISFLEFEEKVAVLRTEFQIPIFMLGEQQHMSDLCQIIIDYF